MNTAQMLTNANDAMRDAESYRTTSSVKFRQCMDLAKVWVQMADVQQRIDDAQPENVAAWVNPYDSMVTPDTFGPHPSCDPLGLARAMAIMDADRPTVNWPGYTPPPPGINDPNLSVGDVVSRIMSWATATRPSAAILAAVMGEATDVLGGMMERAADRASARYAADVDNLRRELSTARYAAYALALLAVDHEDEDDLRHIVTVTERQDKKVRYEMDRTTLVVEPGDRNTTQIGIR
jgi:hypothetical protein